MWEGIEMKRWSRRVFIFRPPLLPARIDSPISGTSQDLVAKDACGITGKNFARDWSGEIQSAPRASVISRKVDDDWELVTVQLRAFAYREA